MFIKKLAGSVFLGHPV